MKLVPANINEAIKHLSGREVSDIQKNIDNLVKNAGYNPKMKGKLINIINGELAINKRNLGKRPVEFLSNNLSLIKMFIRDNWQVDNSLDAEIIESLTYDLKNLIQKYDFSEIDESIKHLGGRTKKELQKGIDKIFSDIEESYGISDYPIKVIIQKIDRMHVDSFYDSLKEAIRIMKSKINDVRFITDTDYTSMTDKAFSALIFNFSNRVNIPAPNGLLHVYPEVKITYFDSNNGNAFWMFDYAYMQKNIDKYRDLIYKEAGLQESIKHLTGRSPEEIENFIKTVKEDIIISLKECPKAEEFLLDDEDTSKALKKINASLKTDDIRIITDADDGLDYMHIFNFLASIPKIGIAIKHSKDFNDGYMDAFPNEKQIHYSGGMGVSAWFFDLNVMLKNIDEYIVKAKNNNWDYLD